MTTEGITHTCWHDVKAEQITPKILRRYLSTTRMTVARIELKAGGVVPRHAHENEQVTCVLTGALRFYSPSGTIDVRAGETARIPGGVEHEVHALEDAVVIDVFSPIREDWINGTDTYFKRA